MSGSSGYLKPIGTVLFVCNLTHTAGLDQQEMVLQTVLTFMLGFTSSLE